LVRNGPLFFLKGRYGQFPKKNLHSKDGWKKMEGEPCGGRGSD